MQMCRRYAEVHITSPLIPQTKRAICIRPLINWWLLSILAFAAIFCASPAEEFPRWVLHYLLATSLNETENSRPIVMDNRNCIVPIMIFIIFIAITTISSWLAVINGWMPVSCRGCPHRSVLIDCYASKMQTWLAIDGRIISIMDVIILNTMLQFGTGGWNRGREQSLWERPDW